MGIISRLICPPVTTGGGVVAFISEPRHDQCLKCVPADATQTMIKKVVLLPLQIGAHRSHLGHALPLSSLQMSQIMTFKSSSSSSASVLVVLANLSFFRRPGFCPSGPSVHHFSKILHLVAEGLTFRRLSFLCFPWGLRGMKVR